MVYEEDDQLRNIGFFQSQDVYGLEKEDETETKENNEENTFDYIFDPSNYIDGSSDNILDDIIDEIDNNQSESKSISENVTNFETISDFNFVVAGDFYCNDETGETIENINDVNPELIITTGDHVKNVKTAKCWIEMSELLRDKMRIAIGNHDAESKKVYKQIVDYHGLKTPYYSHDFNNIHFVSLSTEHPFERGSNQYEFIKGDLEKASNNPFIDWIIVHQHKAMYSTKHNMDDAEELRKTYHPLFEEFNVDLVLSSHNQYYERSYPLIYNKENNADPILIYHKSFTDNNFRNTDGIIFLTVGTGGDELHEIEDHEDYYAIQEEEYGYLNLNLQNNGKTLTGEFHSNDGDIIDYFTVDKI